MKSAREVGGGCIGERWDSGFFSADGSAGCPNVPAVEVGQSVLGKLTEPCVKRDWLAR
jgi:hypothetical protein